jgi:hypothetical protein
LPIRFLENEPRVVTDETVKTLEEAGASRDLIEAAKRAQKTNPPLNGAASETADEDEDESP